MDERKTVLSVEHLTVSFTQYERGFRQVSFAAIRDLSVTVHEGEMVAVVGSSGSGKSLLAHAVMDAVLGAAALGDIGQHFPDNDPAYSGADSLKLARRVAEILKEHGFRIENIDATLLCQRPKLAPYIPAMRQNLADAFGLPVDAVSVKATTEEHLGFTGEGLGIAAHAVALIETL